MMMAHVKLWFEIAAIGFEMRRALFTSGLEVVVVAMMRRTAEESHAANAARLDLVREGFGFAGSGFRCRFGGFFGMVDICIEFAEDTAEDRLTFGVGGVGGGRDSFDRCYRWLYDRIISLDIESNGSEKQEHYL